MDADPISPGGDAVRFSRSDLALMRRAARERWGVPDELRTDALYQCAKILASPDADPRLKVAAARLLAAFDRSDQREDKLDLDKLKVARPEAADARDAWQELYDDINGSE